jgi:hypothetical protein
MANLFDQDIGLNYKGILNLGSTINTALSGTLQAVTDGNGNTSSLQLSTTGVTINSALVINNNLIGSTSGRMNIISQYDLAIQTGNSAGGIGGLFVGGAGQAASARLHVKGDGTNPIAIFQNDSGTNLLTINQGSTANITFGSTFTLIGNTGPAGFLSLIGGNVTGNVGTISIFSYNMVADTSTSSTSNYFNITKSITPEAGSANFRNLIVNYTINASGAQTGTATGIYLNATETNLNGMAHNLMDLQVGGVSQFKVDRLGAVSIGNTVTSAASVASTHKVTVVIGGVTYYLLASNV